MKKYLLFLVFLSPLFASSQWQQTKGPYGGNVQAFCEYNNALYAGTGTGLFVSTDNGDNWNFVNVGYPISITAIAEMGGRIFAGMNGAGIICSSDNGITWQKVNLGLSPNDRYCGYCINALSVEGNRILAATGDGLYKMEGLDTTWTSVASGFYVTFLAKGDTILTSASDYSGYGASTGISTDGGLTFRGITYPGINPSQSMSNSFDLTSMGIFATCGNDLFFSIDLGYTWISLYHDSIDYIPFKVKIFNDTIYLATYNKGIFVSSVNNISWSYTGLTNWSINTFYQSNGIMFAGTGYYGGGYLTPAYFVERGIFAKPANSANWIEKNNGLSAMTIYSIASSGSFIVTGCNGGVFISVDTGFTWTRHDLRLPGKLSDRDNYFNISKIATNGKIIIAGSDNSYPEIFISLDSGTTWTLTNQIFSDFIVHLAIIGNRFILGTIRNIYYSDDFGQNWTAAPLPLSINGITYLSDNTKELFLINSYNSIYTSSDSCATWDSIPRPPTQSANTFLESIISIDSSLFLVDGWSGGLFIGNKDGSNWYHSPVTVYPSIIGVHGNDVFTPYYNNINNNYYYYLMHSYDLGHTWLQESIYFNCPIWPLESSKYYVFANVHGKGIWRYGSQNSVSSLVMENNPAGNFSIYPNPSSGKFTLQSSDPSTPLRVTSVEITNLLGEKIFTSTINLPIAIGKTSTIDLSSQPKGIYFVEMICGNPSSQGYEGRVERRTKKIILE